MGKNYRVVPIRSLSEALKAERDGARFEYTACGDDYDAPALLSGWVPSRVGTGWFISRRSADPAIGVNEPVDGQSRLRAIYPAQQRKPCLG